IFINTLIISILKLVCGFPAPIILAILLNEMRNMILKRTIQTISYLPHFISWVILAGMVSEIFSPQRGVFNYIITLFGGKPIYFLASKDWFRPVLVLTQIWKNAGWGSIIYLATLSSIDIESYDSATIDGANRFQKAVHITIPGLVPVITILFILNLGKILNAGFDQVINLYNPLAYEIADIIDTYVYRIGLIDAKYDFASAVGVFKNVVGVLLIFTSNAVIRKFNEYGIW
ncbi:MAG: sugar ABC transporter permease, partial [Clostridiaceae bacterium]|nr:sugar ABC transporter permease [Clostridiaceae bacterium]